MAMERRSVGKDEEGEVEDVQGGTGGKDSVADEVGIAMVAGEEKKEGEEGDTKEGGGRMKIDDEESEASVSLSTPLKSLSSSLLALLAMKAWSSPTAGISEGKQEERSKKVEQEMAQQQEEEKDAGREGGMKKLGETFELQMQRLKEREGGLEGGLIEESKECLAVE